MITLDLNKNTHFFLPNNEKINRDIIHDCGISKLVISNEYLDGNILSLSTADNLTFQMFNLQVHQDIAFQIEKSQQNQKALNLFYNLGQKFQLISSNKTNQLIANNLYISLPNQKTHYSVNVSANSKFKAIIIRCDIGKFLNDNFCSDEQLPQNLENAINGTYDVFLQKKPISNAVNEILQKCIYTNTEGIEKRMILEAHCKELTAMAISTIGKYKKKYQTPETQISTKEREAVFEAARILEENYANPPLQTQLARIIGLNLNKLSKYFKIIHGLTLNKFLLKFRLEKAKSLLTVEKIKTVASVAEKVGFNNTSYFIRKFKEEFGEYPGDYV